MPNFRNLVKLTFALLALWLGLVWMKVFPRPGFLRPEMDIEPLTYVLGILAASLLAFWKTSDSDSESISSSTAEDDSIYAEIRHYLAVRYAHRVDSKLAGRFPVNLRILSSDAGTSEEGKAKLITVQDEQVGHQIGEIFDQAHGRLLVVGLPGAGKTTLLLQLALELLKRAEAVPATLVAGLPAAKAAGTITRPIPVLLNLATWRSEFGSFEEWLKRILPNELGASKALAEKIRANVPLILLLDGLDEVPEEDRNSCLEALGQYGMKPEHQFVISSRILEYAAAKDAPVYAQVEVAPLTVEQIELNLIAFAGLTPEAKPLLHAIQKDPLLKQAIESPFYLNTAQLLFASGRGWSEFGFVAMDVAGRQKELVERFVENALKYKEKRDYPAEKTKKWLRFLAWKMEEEGLKIFELINVKKSWVKGVGLLEACIFIYFILIFFFKNLIWLFGIFLIGEFAYSFIYKDGEHYEKIKWSYKIVISKSSEYIARAISLSLFLGTVCMFGFFSIPARFLERLIVGLLVGLLFGFLLWLSSGFQKEPFMRLNSPYEKLYYSLAYFNPSFLIHLSIRNQLWSKSVLPLRLVYFLNEMSRSHLLEFDGNLDTETGGGAWRWRHRIIQEYFLNRSDQKGD